MMVDKIETPYPFVIILAIRELGSKTLIFLLLRCFIS